VWRAQSALIRLIRYIQSPIALNLAYYNFVMTHRTLRCTPAMEAGIENSAWTVSDLIDASN